MPRLRPALTGRVTEHRRFVLKLFLDEVEIVEEWVRRLEERIEAVLSPIAEAVRRWTTISATTSSAGTPTGSPAGWRPSD